MNYKIKYTAKDKNGIIIQEGSVVAKHKNTIWDAKNGLEKQLKDENPKIDYIIVNTIKKLNLIDKILNL